MITLRWPKRILFGLAVVVLAGVGYQQWGEARDALRFPAPGQFVPVEHGQLHVRCVGSGSPTVFFISGSGTPSVTLYEAQDRAGRFARTCSYDRAGLGWSPPTDGPVTLKKMVDDFSAIVDRVAPGEPIVLVPESFGGLIALSYFERNPLRVAGAVFDDASEPKLWLAEAPKTIGESKRKALLWKVGWHLGIIRLLYPLGEPEWAKRSSPANRARMRAVFSRPIPSFSRDWTDVVEYSPQDTLPSIQPGSWGSRPIIVLQHGQPSSNLSETFEAGWPAAQARLATLSSNSTAIVALENGHAIAEENPELVARQVGDVLRQLSGTQKAK